MQLVEILGNSNKIKTVDDLLNNFNCIAELAREDVYYNTPRKLNNFL